MLFSTPQFLAFFSIYLVAHFTVPLRFRNYLIILGSTFFYAWWKIEFVWLPYALILIALLGVGWIERIDNHKARQQRMILVIFTLFLPLVFYKYTNFLISIFLGPTLDKSDGLISLTLPLGISFITFTLAAYIIDVAQQKFPAVRKPSMLIAYILFFPHLIAGPILRQNELIPQLERPRQPTFAHFRTSVSIFTLGLVKKLVFADQIGFMVDSVYSSDQSPEPFTAILAIIGFAVQIYCDFSGYTDMAIGIARMIGINLPNNFARPFMALSISELWRRWHITLTRFLLDYIYTPLSLFAARKQIIRKWGKWMGFFVTVVIPINVTFLASGIWHGAGWNFVFFGVFTGIAMSVNFAWRLGPGWRLPKLAAWFLTMVTFVVSLILFRSRSMSIALNVVSAPVVGNWEHSIDALQKNSLTFLLIVAFGLLHRYDDHRVLHIISRKVRPIFIWIAIGFGWLLSALLSQGSSASFVYFDF